MIVVYFTPEIKSRYTIRFNVGGHGVTVSGNCTFNNISAFVNESDRLFSEAEIDRWMRSGTVEAKLALVAARDILNRAKGLPGLKGALARDQKAIHSRCKSIAAKIPPVKI